MKAYLPEVGYGVVLGLAHLVWLIVEYASGLHTTRIALHSILTNLYVVLPALIMWRAIKNRRDVLEGGQLLWWQGMAAGMIVSVVAATLRAPTWWFFLKFINPGFTQAMIEYAVQTGLKRELAEVTYHPTVMAMESTLSPVLLGIFLSAGLTWFARSQVEKPQSPAAA
ncbi:MAG TPA: DUF4199 domain-containing protein [Polyangium sp.]|nr:DUF4199 domain-containing protein [Polyangium sp.]